MYKKYTKLLVLKHLESFQAEVITEKIYNFFALIYFFERKRIKLLVVETKAKSCELYEWYKHFNSDRSFSNQKGLWFPADV